MWDYTTAVIVGVVLHTLVCDATNVVTHCKYTDNEFSIANYQAARSNLTGDAAAFQRIIDQIRSHATFVTKGYERCHDTQGPGYCYTLAIRDESQQLQIVKQGCWMDPSNSGSCRATSCGVEQSSSKTQMQNVTFSFCCCHGNKCNQMDAGTGSEAVVKTNIGWAKTDTGPVASKHKGVTGSKNRICAYKKANPASQDTSSTMTPSTGDNSDNVPGIVLPDGKTVQCKSEGSHCFSYWMKDSDNQTINVLYQDCWDVTFTGRGRGCNSSTCTPNDEAHTNNHNNSGHFCCCFGDMCNNDISTVIVPRVTTTARITGPESHQIHDPSYKERTIVISLLSVFSLAIIILGVYLLYRCCSQSQHMPLNQSQANDFNTSPGFDIEDLKICSLVSKGRYSEVWKGSLNEQDVAVKIYSANYRQYYYSEKNVYSLPHMSHESLLKFYGAEERNMADGCTQYLLVLQYVPTGTLTTYLKNNSIDWFTMCKMCYSLAKGLSHLHSDIGLDNVKPTIAHRDFNSRNILVKNDLTLVVADLGFAKLIHSENSDNPEESSLTEVGTLRYMAPELLEGAVNLRDCGACLKQIDIYSFGLVMWEISSRCVDLYQGCPMPDYNLPFHAELGGHPTLEEMQYLVSRNKTRPRFPEVWKESNQAVRALKETVEECWDHDAEARLTAFCVEERIIDMKNLWSHDNRNKGVTPTINTALLSHVSNSNKIGYHGNGVIQWGGLHSGTDSTSSNVVAEGSTSALIINDIHDSMTGVSESVSSSHPPQWLHDRSGSISTSTVETTISATPVEPEHPHPKSQNVNLKNRAALQPHQGRNPTVERNTHKRSDEELAVVGNKLLYGKDKVDAESTQSAPTNMSVSDNIFDSLTDNLETSLMQNDILNHHRTPPISYLQNHVHTNTGDLPPKMTNNPGNGAPNAQHNINPVNQRLAKTKKPKEMGILGQLALLGKLALSGGKSDIRKPSERGPRVDNGTVYDSIGQYNPLFEPQVTMETEVRLANGSTVVRPANLRVGSNPSQQALLDVSHANTNLDNDLAVAEVGVARLEKHNKSQPSFKRLRGAPYSKSTSDLSPQKTCSYTRLQEDIKLTRPSTLSLKGHNYSQQRGRLPGGSMGSLSGNRHVAGNGLSKGLVSRKHIPTNDCNSQIKPSNVSCKKDMVDSTERIKARVKTPPSEKRGRFSLYDDRLMSDKVSSRDSSVYGSEGKLQKPSISLQQFKAVENSGNTYIAADCTC